MKSSSRHIANAKRRPCSFVGERKGEVGCGGVTEDQVCVSCLRFAGRFVSSRWHCVRCPSSHSSLQLRHGLNMAQGDTPAPIMPAIMPSVITPIATIAMQPGCRAGSAARANAGRRLCRHQPELHGKRRPDDSARRLRLAQLRLANACRSRPSCPVQAHRARVTLGAWGCTNAGARSCRRQRKRRNERKRRVERNRSAGGRRDGFGFGSSSVVAQRGAISAAIRRDAAACGARDS